MVGPSGDVARSTACTRSPGCARRGPFGPSGGDIRPAWPLTFGHCHVAARWGFIGRCSIRACFWLCVESRGMMSREGYGNTLTLVKRVE